MILEIVSPEASLFRGEVSSITLPGVDGSFQILNNHAPIVSILKAGEIKIVGQSFNFTKESSHLFNKVDSQTYTLSIGSGTIEMKDNKAIVLVD